MCCLTFRGCVLDARKQLQTPVAVRDFLPNLIYLRIDHICDFVCVILDADTWAVCGGSRGSG